MARHQGVEEMPQRRQRQILGGVRSGQVLDEAPGQPRRHLAKLDALRFAPGEKAPHGAGIGAAGVGIGDLGREELIGGKGDGVVRIAKLSGATLPQAGQHIFRLSQVAPKQRYRDAVNGESRLDLWPVVEIHTAGSGCHHSGTIYQEPLVGSSGQYLARIASASATCNPRVIIVRRSPATPLFSASATPKCRRIRR